ncbi:recombinase family protein [Bifidobacterium psychraerophilum]|uniref:recombinase family protein n=1 Tax=Bifidobacterium psychraerophilum TaxID=218140 RepID=UPI0039E7C19C
MTIFREYDDHARTGTNTNRPGFQQMMSEISEIKPVYLVMWKNDRLGPQRHGCVCRSADDPCCWMPDSLHRGYRPER